MPSDHASEDGAYGGEAPAKDHGNRDIPVDDSGIAASRPIPLDSDGPPPLTLPDGFHLPVGASTTFNRTAMPFSSTGIQQPRASNTFGPGDRRDFNRTHAQNTGAIPKRFEQNHHRQSLEDTDSHDDLRQPTRPATTSLVMATMRKWNLSFSGKPEEDAETFLARVDEGRNLLPVDDTQLLLCIPFFLNGIALQWFRLNRTRWETWSTFKTACRQRFGDPDYQFALREELIKRTQGEDEPIADFLTCIRGICDRIRPRWPEADQLRSAHRNMLPRLQVAIHLDDLYDFDSFEHIAMRIEASYRAAKTYRAPPSPEKSLCPELAYRGTRTAHPPQPTNAKGRNSSSANPLYSVIQQEQQTTETEKASRKSDPISSTEARRTPRPSGCWNCGKIGHRFNACREPRRVFCYRCGCKGVSTPNCPRCSG